jgi:predicted HTH domain antitoxin
MEDTEWKRDWINAFEEELEKRGVKIWNLKIF